MGSVLSRSFKSIAPQLKLQLTGVEFRERPYDYDRALAEMAPDDRKFLFAVGFPFFFLDRASLAEAALRQHVASMVNSSEAVIAGGLMSTCRA